MTKYCPDCQNFLGIIILIHIYINPVSQSRFTELSGYACWVNPWKKMDVKIPIPGLIQQFFRQHVCFLKQAPADMRYVKTKTKNNLQMLTIRSFFCIILQILESHPTKTRALPPIFFQTDNTDNTHTNERCTAANEGKGEFFLFSFLLL